MTRIHLVRLSSSKKKTLQEDDDDEIYYGQLSDDIDYDQIQAAPFMQGQGGHEKPKL